MALDRKPSDNPVVLSALQSRLARVTLGLGVRDLAAAAGVSTASIARLERGERLKPATLARIRAAIEARGVLVLDENGGGEGVRLARPGEG